MKRKRFDSTSISRNRLSNRRQFLKKSTAFTGGAIAACALSLSGNTQIKAEPRLDENVKTETITYTGKTGEIRAYLARLDDQENRPAVIVIHENRGLDAHIQDVTRRFAREGFLTIAPDALSPLGGTPEDPNLAQSLINQLNEQDTIQNFVAAVDYLKTAPLSTGKVGCTGFCWGGGMTNQVAVNSPDLLAAVPFYGSQPAASDVPKIKAALLCHYASLDSRINAGIPAFEAALKAASIEYTIFMYEGANHAFFNDTRSDRYNKEAAELAWSRTLGFFNEKLEGNTGLSGRYDKANLRPSILNVHGNYPNPFNPETTIEFFLKTDGFVTLDIMNIAGRKIDTLIAKKLSKGVHSVMWDGRDNQGSLVPSGSYVCRLINGDFMVYHRMMLIR